MQADALRDFVDKEERGAITDCVTRALRREQGDVLRRPDTALDNEGDVAAALAGRRNATEVLSVYMVNAASSRTCFGNYLSCPAVHKMHPGKRHDSARLHPWDSSTPSPASRLWSAS